MISVSRLRVVFTLLPLIPRALLSPLEVPLVPSRLCHFHDSPPADPSLRLALVLLEARLLVSQLRPLVVRSSPLCTHNPRALSRLLLSLLPTHHHPLSSPLVPSTVPLLSTTPPAALL